MSLYGKIKILLQLILKKNKQMNKFIRKEIPYKLSKTGKDRLSQLHPDLQEIILEYLYYKDLSIICSYRGKEEQELAFTKGNSKARFGQSPHNFNPARAVDIVPYPIPMKGTNWDNDSEEWNEQAELFMKIANEKNIEITWGGNFTKLVDKPHFELKNWKSL